MRLQSLSAPVEMAVDMDFLRRGFERKSEGTPKYEKAKKLLAVIAEMTRSLGIRSLVEGIDESDQHEYLRSLGFGLLQGFYFGQTAPALPIFGQTCKCLTKTVQAWF